MSRTALRQQSHRNQEFVGSQQKMSRRVELNSRKLPGATREGGQENLAGMEWQGWYACTWMAESLHCSPETPQYKMFLVLKKLKTKKKGLFNTLFNWLHCIVTHWYF